MKKIIIYCLLQAMFLVSVSQDSTDRKSIACMVPPILPVPGYNQYDGLQLALLIQNLQFLNRKVSFYAAPAYAFGSKRMTGYGSLLYPFGSFETGISGGAFSINKATDINGKKIFADMYKVSPYLRYYFDTSDNVSKYIAFQVYIIGESGYNYTFSPNDSLYYPEKTKIKNRYLNQVTFGYDKDRKLFPYGYQLQLQQATSFYRINASLNYFFNYLNKGGVQARLFAAKFGYIGGRTDTKSFETQRYQPKLTAVTGYEDYTYSNYFIGRNETQGFLSQQIMMRDGGLKLRTDLFQDLQGRSDKWIASMNLTSTMPGKIFPENFPLKIFLDVGTYADVWKKDSPDARFLYVAGLQLSFIKNIINIYAPVIYSKKFRDSFAAVPEENNFFKKISFSFDIQRLNLRQYARNR